MLWFQVKFAKYGIMVNNVCPGPTLTPMWDKLDKEYCELNSGWKEGAPWGEKYGAKQLIKRMGKVEDTSRAVSWLLDPDNTYITGTNIKVCGGNMIG